MLITTQKSVYSNPISASRAIPVAPEVAASEPSDGFAPSGEAQAGQIKWGPITALVGGFGATAGLAASGLGWASAVPAFLVGGATGFALIHEGIMSSIGGKDNSGAGAIASMAGLAGGLAVGVGAATLALSQGSPMIGLGFGVGAAALALGGSLYLANG